MTDIIARHCHVSGRVQGVGFRASARQKATELGCSGYARNLPDGRVEVLVLAEPAAAARMIEWLWQGPPAAHVRSVEVSEIALEQLESVPVGFATR